MAAYPLNKARQIRDVAIHAEEAFSDDYGVLVFASMSLQHFLQGIAVIMVV